VSGPLQPRAVCTSHEVFYALMLYPVPFAGYAAERVQREAYLNSVRQGGGPLDVPVESLVASMRVSE
jgi:hypothetical protein